MLMMCLWSLAPMVCGTSSPVLKRSALSPSNFENSWFKIYLLQFYRNPEDPSQMARILANEARERWDLFNEINRTKKKLSLEGMDEVRKKSSL